MIRFIFILIVSLIPLIALPQIIGSSSDDCDARFQVVPDAQNPMLIHFQDQSAGEVTMWQWNFGDGVTSVTQHPDHEYAASGNYFVCLTVSNTNTGGTCHDVLCIEISVGQSIPCKASFIAELDSLNPKPFSFRFTSTSAGYPNSWHWDFGDGVVAAGQPVVVHQFSSSADANVCLRVERKEAGQIVSSDSVCQIIRMPLYYNLGGHLFSGEKPINNPVTTGDTGLVYLYRQSGSRLIALDTTKATYLGYYMFPNLLRGSYLVKSTLTPGSAGYNRYIPASFPGSATWLEATMLQIGNGHEYHAHIYMIEKPVLEAGVGMITGKVVAGEPGVVQIPVESADVILFDTQMNPLDFCQSGTTGNYTFRDLPFGAYHLYVDKPGKYSRYTAIWIDEPHPLADSVILGLFDYDVTGIDRSRQEVTPVYTVHPNPVTSSSALSFRLHANAKVLVQIHDIRGNLIWQTTGIYDPGSVRINLPSTWVNRGIFILRLAIDGEWRWMERLVGI